MNLNVVVSNYKRGREEHCAKLCDDGLPRFGPYPGSLIGSITCGPSFPGRFTKVLTAYRLSSSLG